MKDDITIQLPASSSNCGPGFDTLSIAVQLYQFVRLRRREGETVQALEERAFSPRVLAMALAARELFCQRTGEKPVGFDFDVWGEIPLSRGLGHSAVVRAGILNALNEMHGNPLDKHALIGMTASLDAAGDDASAVHNGGFNVVRSDPGTGNYVDSLHFDVPPELSIVIVAPEIRVHTADARDALPRELPFQDAVRSMNSASWLVAVFATGQYERLRDAVTDFLHQKYRQRLCPFVPEAIEAGTHAGAWAGWLSGSGSSVLCLCPPEHSKEVGKAMREVFTANGVEARVIHSKADNEGLKVVKST